MGKHYIDNKEFERVLLAYKEDPQANEEDLVEMFTVLIENIVASFKFNVDPDDATQECFLLILKTIRNFTPDKGSAFNYFTTIIVNNLKLIYTKKKKYNMKIEDYMEINKDTIEA